MLSIIIPTIGNRVIELKRLFKSLEDQSNVNFEIILVIQDNHLFIEELTINYRLKFKICNLKKRGLSYARNEGIKLIHEQAKLVSFSDDDCWYPNNAVELAIKNYEKLNCSVCYQIFDTVNNEPYKNYDADNKLKLSLRDSLKVSSIEIFVPKHIIESGIRFDERFGLGTNYPSGEENIFLFDILKKGNVISYIPTPIVFHLKPDWATKEYIFKGKGALFSRLYNKYIALIFIIVYAFKKRAYSSNIKSDFKAMLREVLSYK